MNALIIKEIVADFHQRDLPTFTQRLYNLDCPENKIRTLIGPRRSGKTYTFFQLIHELLASGVRKENILYFNFEDERLLPFETAHLALLLSTYYEMYPQLKDETVYLFFDEIQNIPSWEKFIRRIHDTENVRINLTGSSSKLMSREIATSLRGRTLSFEIFPFRFQEFLRHRKLPVNDYSSKSHSHIVHAFEDYLFRGGFPEVLDVAEPVRIRVLQDYFNVLLYRDLIERFQIRNHALIRYLIKFMLANCANPFSVNKFVNDSKSQGYHFSKDSIHNYLSFIEDSLSFSLMPIFSESPRKMQVNYRKVYPVDQGLVTAMNASTLYNTGRLLETMVYNHLRRAYRKDQIFYHKINGQEIDFVATSQGKVSELIQVCEDLASPETRHREISALAAAMGELDISHSFIITRSARDEESTTTGVIHITPFWEWVIEFSKRDKNFTRMMS